MYTWAMACSSPSPPPPLLPLQKKQQQLSNNEAKQQWNSLIQFHANQKDAAPIVTSYRNMGIWASSPAPPLSPSSSRPAPAPRRLQAIEVAASVHSCIKNTPALTDNAHVRISLVDSYCKCGLVAHAAALLHEIDHTDSIS